MPTLDYDSKSRNPRPPTTRRARAIALAIILTIPIAAVVFTIRALDHGRYDANRVRCAMNMRQIGQAIAMYANTHGGTFPKGLDTLLVAEDLNPQAFTCPSTNDIAATGPTTQAVAAGLRQPGHCSYVYLGKGLTQQTVSPNMVIVYEPLTNHGGQGMNVLYGDYSVEWVNGHDAQIILNKAAAGTGPVVLTTRPW